MRREVENLSAILPKVHELAVKVDDMIGGWESSEESVSVDLSLISDYLESYVEFTGIMADIRQNNPSVYMEVPAERELVMKAILRAYQYQAQADRCKDLLDRVEKFMKDSGLVE